MVGQLAAVVEQDTGDARWDRPDVDLYTILVGVVRGRDDQHGWTVQDREVLPETYLVAGAFTGRIELEPAVARARQSTGS
jgi:hypothetical protein